MIGPFIFAAVSGNLAYITIATIANRSACDFAWRDVPPTAQDMREAEQAVAMLLAQDGIPNVRIVSSVYEPDDELRKREQRRFLGGGAG